MKKLILIAISALAIGLFSAQDSRSQGIPLVGTDTVVNTSVVNLTIKTTTSANNMSLMLVTTKLTGTVAGTAILQASNDGTNWLTINTAGADTATITNVAAFAYFWNEAPNRYLHYRLNITGSGTSTYIVRAYAILRNL